MLPKRLVAPNRNSLPPDPKTWPQFRVFDQPVALPAPHPQDGLHQGLIAPIHGCDISDQHGPRPAGTAVDSENETLQVAKVLGSNTGGPLAGR
jgi:hypothetical protein